MDARQTLQLIRFIVSFGPLWLSLLALVSPFQSQASAPPEPVIILSTHGVVEVLRDGARSWDVATTNAGLLRPGDQLRTRRGSEATLRLADRTVTRLAPESHLRVLPPLPREPTLEVLAGRLFFLERDKPGRLNLRTATTIAGVEGTEFSLEVAADGTTRLDLFDGKVSMRNPAGRITLTSGQAGIARPGAVPVVTAMIAAVNVIQWNLYYPAVLNVEELFLPDDIRALLADSLLAYQRGNLLGASAHYPEGRTPILGEEKVYVAAIRLGVGHVDQALELLDTIPLDAGNNTASLASALRLLIAAVKFQERPSKLGLQLNTSTEWLAESYYQQSRSDLPSAREAAAKAVVTAPQFAFALARLAELEFSFARIGAAQEKLERSLALAPDNAQAVALAGFLLAARNRVHQAIRAFDHAIALDPGLGNAWLGRGLCHIRQGRIAEGRQDLLIAAATEPQRAVLRSYLGKSFTETGDYSLARHELELAQQLDPNDPTAWLYSALLNQLDRRINRAIDDLEHSQLLNTNRAVYRSRELLDQDRAVRGVNLANIYADASLTEVAFREAVHAVHENYGNFSAHWFLANSLNRLRDPRQVNLRYESPWLTEYLVANLLAPVGAGTLSQLVSAEEYSRLFERNGAGLVSTTEYFSGGDWLQAASQHGRLGNLSYALEEHYRSENGFWPNSDFESLTLSLQSKLQLGQNDDLFFQAVYYDADGGDVAQHYSQASVNPSARFEENQEPLLIAGYHHTWTPNSHTLVLAARLEDTFSLINPSQPVLDFVVTNADEITLARRFIQPLDYERRTEVYLVEGQHLLDWGNHRSIIGARYHRGEIDTTSTMPEAFPNPATDGRFELGLERISGYGYHHWQVFAPLRLIGGVSYDRLIYPENFRSPPIHEGREAEEQISPKAGLILTPADGTTVRAAYTRSLGGVSIDQSFQLEPAQVAGFVQTFRSLVPESVAGGLSAASYETFGIALDQKFPTRTYIGVSLELLGSEAARQAGVFKIDEQSSEITPSVTDEDIDFRERTFRVDLNQLLGEQWAVGATYRVSKAKLRDTFTDAPEDSGKAIDFVPRRREEATLHQAKFFTAWSSSLGLFARVDSVLSSQSNYGYSPKLSGDNFWQFNLFAGYRFPRRKAELAIGLLNFTDQDYRLNPLNLTPELPRERTLALRLRMAF